MALTDTNNNDAVIGYDDIIPRFACQNELSLYHNHTEIALFGKQPLNMTRKTAGKVYGSSVSNLWL